MTIDELVKKYRTISAFLNERWPLADQNQRTFARMMKVTEELGELSDEILTSMNLQRTAKFRSSLRKMSRMSLLMCSAR